MPKPFDPLAQSINAEVRPFPSQPFPQLVYSFASAPTKSEEEMSDTYTPIRDRREVAGPLGRARHEYIRRRRPSFGGAAVLQPHDVPVPVRRRAPRRQHVRVHRGRHLRTLAQAAGRGRVRADGLRRVRHPLGELRAQGGHASDGVDSAQHRELHGAAQAYRRHVRLEPHGRYDGSEVLQVDAVDLFEAPRGRVGREEAGAGQLVPVLPHRARQRAGDRRRVRALRHDGRAAAALPVVLQDHEVRGAFAREPVLDRLVGDDQEGAGQLDRQE